METGREGRDVEPATVPAGADERAAVFRRATNLDRAVVVQLVDDALREYGLGVLLEASDKDLVDLEAHYFAQGGRFEIMEDAAGDALGVLGWRDAGDGVVELKKLYLAPAARGRGLGRRAVERVVESARATGARALVLETAHVLAQANRLYLRCGFRPVRGTEAASFRVLSEQCDLAYRLDLAAPPAGQQQ